MAWHNDTYIIGEKVKVLNETEIGVVTRIDFRKGFICVLFERTREVIYDYPLSLENGTITSLVKKK